VTARLLFRDDAYLRNCEATVTGLNEQGGILLDRTVFYATAGGQPGDKGTLSWDGGEATIATTVYDEAKDVVHVPAEGQIPDKAELTATLNRLVTEDHPVTFRWITDEEMAENQHLIRTMSVKPPVGTGRVRLVMIGTDGKVDLQPCGGTHLSSTAAIGPVVVSKIENKGKINRRIRVAFQ